MKSSLQADININTPILNTAKKSTSCFFAHDIEINQLPSFLVSSTTFVNHS